MGHLKIYKDNLSDTTQIANRFIDEYMKDANDAQLKIYLYLTRMLGSNKHTSISDIADKFNHTEKDVLRALKYWELHNLLCLEYDKDKSLTGIHLNDFTQKDSSLSTTADTSNEVNTVSTKENTVPSTTPLASNPVAETKEPVMEVKSEEAPSMYVKPNYSLDDMKAFKANEEAAEVVFIVEQYIGKPLTLPELKTLYFIMDQLHFSFDLIDYLVQYCIERGKKDFRYIESVAINWAQQNITTPKQAASVSHKYDKSVYTIMKSLGKSNNPTNKEVDYIQKWTKSFGFTLDIIIEACERTVLATDRNRFAYADTILTKWYQSKVTSKADISNLDVTYQKAKNKTSDKVTNSNKFNQFTQNSYDFDQLEKELLSN